MPFTDRLQSRDIIPLIVSALDAPVAPWFDALANRVTSDKDSEVYTWLGSAPRMRAWKGGRKPSTLGQNEFRVPNLEFEASLEIPTRWLTRDHTGQLRMKIAELGESAADHKFELLSATIDSAGSTVCYDGQYFFDTDHQEGESPVQSNITSVDIVTPTAPTAAEMETAILTAIQNMYGIYDDKGRKSNGSAKNFTVMVPLNGMRALASALKADVLLEGGQARSSNMRAVGSLMGLTIEGVINPRLTWTDKFAVFRTDAAIKPFVYQVEEEPITSVLAEGSDEEVKNKRHLYAIDASYNTGLNQWRGAQLVQLT
jgi:hypothetical protein